MIRLSTQQKERLAAIVRHPVVGFLMGLAVKVSVARHRAGVTMVCFDHDDRILLLRHVFHPATPWDLPGGWLDAKESPAECALRELREETGLTAEIGQVIGITREPRPAHLVITYMARLAATRPETVLSSEILEAAWFAADDLPKRLRPSTRLAIGAAVEKLPSWPTTERVSNV